MAPDPLKPTLFPYTTLFRSRAFRSLHAWSPRRISKVEQARLLRSEEHTSELQSRENIVCRLLLEKKIEVSEVGFGVWTLASDWWGRVDDKQVMLHAALDAGI